MATIPLLGGSYSARSIIANAQRCINYFPEHNPKDSPVPTTHYQRPGLRPLGAGPIAPVRGIYRASNGNGYCVIGQGVYFINRNWQLTLLGLLTVKASNLVSFVDNGITILLVDGSQLGYTITLADNTFAIFSDPTGTFNGANKVDYIDTFVIWNMPGTKNFGSTLSNELTIDPLYIAGKTNWPDNLMTLSVNRHLILLFGQLKTEMWYDAGLPTFPFAEFPGAFFEHGLVAIYSVASQDLDTFWLGQDFQGQGVVYRIRGYECKRVSNHALEFQIRQMAAAGADISDAIGYTHQFDGHVFYVLTFVSGDQTWAYDASTELWSQRAWTGPNGNLHRDRINCTTFLYGTNVAGDWENGTLYSIDPNTYTDTVAGVIGPISFIRGFPHIQVGEINLGQANLNRPVESNGHLIQFNQFLLNMECGTGAVDALGNPATVSLRWSDDRGRNFDSELLQSTGAPGQYLTYPQWRGLGTARDRIFEITHSINGPAALNGAWVDCTVLQK